MCDDAKAAFDRLDRDAKQALYNGDLDLDDVLDDDLDTAARHDLMVLIERWGDHACI